MNLAADDPQSTKQTTAFLGGLQERGWTLGGNLQIEYRWTAADGNLTRVDIFRKNASELLALAPDVILVAGGTAVGELQQVTRTVPIVFVEATDPVNRGLVASLARPGGNIVCEGREVEPCKSFVGPWCQAAFKAFSIHPIKWSSRSGLFRKQTAPAFMARARTLSSG